jgi:IS30 family transposase
MEDRAIPGHWEGDLLAGSKNSHIAMLVERHSRFTMLIDRPRYSRTSGSWSALQIVIRLIPSGTDGKAY